MKCAACHHEMNNKRGEIDLRIAGVLYLVRNVLYEECPSCGEKVISPDIAKMLYQKIKKEEFVEEMVNVPVLDGTYG
ncbi:MAG: YgiT-type zinc finger protein [Deltaproteobacteria bacterium]|nr:YgiT-type zinc finger protein [Deltaproteobacteria bacterium]